MPEHSRVNSSQHSSRHGSVETNLTSIHEDAGSTPGLDLWVKAFGSVAAVAKIQSLAQELPYAVGEVIK